MTLPTPDVTIWVSDFTDPHLDFYHVEVSEGELTAYARIERDPKRNGRYMLKTGRSKTRKTQKAEELRLQAVALLCHAAGSEGWGWEKMLFISRPAILRYPSIPQAATR